MASEIECQSFISNLDESTRVILNRMDLFDGGRELASTPLSGQVLSLLLSNYENLQRVAETLAGSDNRGEFDDHLETLLILISWAPNAEAYWYITALVENRPDIYGFLFQKLVSDKPLKMHSKKVRERLTFHLKREAVSRAVFDVEIMTMLTAALGALKRA